MVQLKGKQYYKVTVLSVYVVVYYIDLIFVLQLECMEAFCKGGVMTKSRAGLFMDMFTIWSCGGVISSMEI